MSGVASTEFLPEAFDTEAPPIDEMEPGEFAAFVFKERGAYLLNLCHVKLGNRLDAEDVVGYLTLKLAEGARPTDPTKWAAFVDQTARNRARDILRHRVVVARNTPRLNPVVEGDLTQHDALLSLECTALTAALSQLPERQRKVLVFRYCQDRTVKEIAKILGIPEGTVKSDAARGKAMLKGMLRSEGSEDIR